MTPPRVLLVSPGWPRAAFANGIVTYVDSVKRGLEAAGCEVRVLSFAIAKGGEDAVLLQGAFSRRGALARLFTRALWRLAPRLADRLFDVLDAWVAVRALHRTWPFDLVEIEESRGLSLWFARAVRVPVIVRLHGPWFLNGRARGAPEDAAFRSLVAREGRAIERADGVSAPSRDVLERVRSHYQLPLPDAVVIPNPGPDPDPRSRWNLRSAEPGLVVFIGRFDRHKGADLVVDATVKLAAEGRRVRLVIAGHDSGFVDDAGRRWSFAEYLAGRVPAERRASIEFLGEVGPARLVELRQRASAVVVASRYEVFGIALLEALAQGCPVVCSDAGAFTEIVSDGRSALVFPSGDTAALARRLAELMDDPARAAELGARGLADYGSRYQSEPIAAATLEFYERVLARSRGLSEGPAASGGRSRPSASG